jgi:hypothetical protein
MFCLLVMKTCSCESFHIILPYFKTEVVSSCNWKIALLSNDDMMDEWHVGITA